MPCFRLLRNTALLLLLFLEPVWAQVSLPTQGHQPPGDASQQSLEVNPAIQQNLAKERQKQRFEAVKRDSQQLLELAAELKQAVDKSGENVLSLDIMRKAERIEKLARQVKNNMRGE
jgi:hypothetical protein